MIIKINSNSKQFKMLELLFEDYLIIITSEAEAKQSKSELKRNGFSCRIGRQYSTSQIKGAKDE